MPNRFNRFGYSDTNFLPASFNPTVFVPQTEDLGILQNSLNKIEERQLATSQQRSAVARALADIKLNAAEDAWKTDYINNIEGQINSLVDLGDYSGALNRAVELAGKVYTDPALRGRERANRDFEEKQKQILARTDINQVTKDRWIEQNPYHYEDKVDANGNVVGGSEWKPTWNPVSRYDMTKLYGLAKELAAVEAGGGESASFLDENGNLTSDPSKGFYGMAVKRGSKWERLSKEKLQNVFNALFKQAPEAMDSMLQDMDDRRWQYNKASEEDKKSFIGTDIIKDDGTFRTPEEYLAYRANPVLSEMAYNHRWSTVDYGNAYALRAKDLKDRAAKSAFLDAKALQNNTTMTIPVEIDLKDRAGRAYGTINTAMNKINELYGDIPIANNPEYKRLVNNFDYKGLANYLTRFTRFFKNDPKKIREFNSAIRLLREEGDNFKAFMAPLEKEDQNAVKAYFSLQSGIPLEDAATNKYTQRVANLKNELFTIKGQPIDDIVISFDNPDYKDVFLNKLGIDERELRNHNLTLGTYDGKPALRVNKNSDALTKIADAYNSSNDYNGIGDFFKLRPMTIGRIRPSDNKIVYGEGINPINWGKKRYDVLMAGLGSNSGIVKELENKVDNIYKKVGLNSIEPLQVKPFDDYNTQMLNQLWLNGNIETTEYKEMKKEFEDNNIRELGFALSRPSNFTFYGRRNELGNAVKLSEEEAQEKAADILKALDEGLVEISPSDAPTGKGYGTLVRIKNKDSKNITTANDVIYIDGLFDGPASQAIARNPELLAQHGFKQARAIRARVKDVTGRQINYDSPNALNEYKASKLLDEIYSDIDERKSEGKIITRQEAERVATNLLMMSGYEEGSEAMKANRSILVSKLLRY